MMSRVLLIAIYPEAGKPEGRKDGKLEIDQTCELSSLLAFQLVAKILMLFSIS